MLEVPTPESPQSEPIVQPVEEIKPQFVNECPKEVSDQTLNDVNNEQTHCVSKVSEVNYEANYANNEAETVAISIT